VRFPRFGEEGLIPSWCQPALDEQEALILPATQPSPLDPLDWLKEIVKLGPTKDWKQNMSATYRSFAAQGPGGIPRGLLQVVSTAPSYFGELIRETAFRERLDEKGDACTPTHEGVAAIRNGLADTIRAGPHKDLLPLPWCPEAAEAMIVPTGRRGSTAYVQSRRMWLLQMTLILNYQYLVFSSASQRPATLLPPGPPSPAQAVAAGLLGQAADVRLERSERFPNFKAWHEELRGQRLSYDGVEEAAPK